MVKVKGQRLKVMAGFKFVETNRADYRVRTAQEEAIARDNHKYMQEYNCKAMITIGTMPQKTWAISIAEQFLFYAHAWGFKKADIDLLFSKKGKYARFWIDNKCERSGEATTRMAIEKELEEYRLTAQAEVRSAERLTEDMMVKNIKRCG